MSAATEEYLAVLKASYDYEPQSEDEIAIKENQLLFLLDKVDDDWWKVKVKGDSQEEESPLGLVPAAYVEPAEHTSIVKVLYEYDANSPGELSVKEDELLLVFDKEDDWLLVQSQTEGGKAGFVPSNYVQESTGEEEAAETTPARSIVIPPSPPRPVSTYVDPADRVASSKVTADDIKTWAVLEIDKKGKKKKGTLGVGNGAVFFASESDKTPVQKWSTSDIEQINVEKTKHLHVDVGGPTPISLHFNVGSKDNADAIAAKLQSSKELSTAGSEDSHDAGAPGSSKRAKKNGVSVHFSSASPAIIPPREPSDDEDEVKAEPEEPRYSHDTDEGSDPGKQTATALYDFDADGEDELSVKEGEVLVVLEKDSDEWWKCQNTKGVEGVVPASYLEIAAQDEDDSAAREAAALEESQRLEREKKERAEQERAERERKKLEADRRAKAAAAAAEVDQKRREKEKAAAEAETQRQQREAKRAEAEKEKERSRSSPPKSNTESSSSTRASSDSKRGPPPEKTRVWHDRTGQFRVEAAFLGFANGKLKLHKVNGVVIEVPSEKMSQEDLKYIERVTKKNSSTSTPPSGTPPSGTPPSGTNSDDDQPLAERRKSLTPRASRNAPPKKGPAIDWFEFFLSAGCDIDDCTRYAASFERDKIDEAILPDITDSTMRSLGLREGDIIRVTKVINQRKPSKPNESSRQEQLLKDEEYARLLQAEESNRKLHTTSPAPNLFAAPDGSLKPRRGRPQPSKSLPSSNVDLIAISTASGQIKRTGSPMVTSPDNARAPSTTVNPPPRSSSAVVSGFDDDAWTNRPSSAKPITSTPPIAAPMAPSAAPLAPTPPVQTQPPVQNVAPAQPAQFQATGSHLAKTTESDIFEQLARLSELRAKSPAVATTTPVAASPPVVPPVSYQSGLGMGPSPVPMGQIQTQQSFTPQPQPPQPSNGPRGPYAPVPANQSLLQPLIPTTTGFNSFVPTRPHANPSPFQGQSLQQSFLSTQPTGFSHMSQPIPPQPTGFPSSGPLLSQPTGMNGAYSQAGTFHNPSSFGVQSNPTGFVPGFGQLPFNNGIQSPPPVPPLPSSLPNNTSPANIFAQMKSGAFGAGNDNSVPQSSDKYDALRPNPLIPQATGWGYQGSNGFQGGYGYQH